MVAITFSIEQKQKKSLAPLIEVFESVEDPRVHRGKKHDLSKILVISLFAVAAGACSWRQFVEFGTLHKTWFAKYFDLGTGIPSHDTFRRVFGLLTPKGTQLLLKKWFEKRKIKFNQGRQICIDGKTVRGTSKWKDEDATTHIVTAYLPEEGISLAQSVVPKKGNEITAMPDLLELINLKGACLTGDAMFTQKGIVSKIVDSQGHYCLALKGNQKGLKQSVEGLFAGRLPSTRKHEEIEKNRGRIEKRRILTSTKVNQLKGYEEWRNLKAVVCLESFRYSMDEDQIVPEKRYYISDMLLSPQYFLQYIRRHWSIENNLHRTLDVHFKEDAWQMRQRNAASNLSVLRKIAGTILSQIDSHKAILHKQMWVNGSEEFRDRMINMEF